MFKTTAAHENNGVIGKILSNQKVAAHITSVIETRKKENEAEAAKHHTVIAAELDKIDAELTAIGETGEIPEDWDVYVHGDNECSHLVVSRECNDNINYIISIAPHGSFVRFTLCGMSPEVEEIIAEKGFGEDTENHRNGYHFDLR